MKYCYTSYKIISKKVLTVHNSRKLEERKDHIIYFYLQIQFGFVLESSSTGNIFQNTFILYKKTYIQAITFTNAKHLINSQEYQGTALIEPHQFTISVQTQ